MEFYSDRCPFCNSLAPEIIKAAKQVHQEKSGAVKFGAINSRVYDEVATHHEVVRVFCFLKQPITSTVCMNYRLQAGHGSLRFIRAKRWKI